MRLILFLFLFAGVLPSQPFTFGVKGGVRFTGDLDSYFATSESKRYVVGPMVTARLPFGFRLEFDALYRRVGNRTSFGDTCGFFTERDRGNSWEFPMVVRHSIGHGIYGGVGYAPRVINGSGHIHAVSALPVYYSEHDVPGSWNTTHGVVGTAGIEKHAGPLHIAPEVRFTWWNQPALDLSGSHGFAVQSTRHQVDLMVGITFP